MKTTFDYFENTAFAVTVSEKDGTVVYQNAKAAQNDGKAIGKNIFRCHKPKTNDIIRHLLATGESNTYEYTQKGKRYLVKHTPWYKEPGGEVAGLIEMIIDLPDSYPAFDRDKTATKGTDIRRATYEDIPRLKEIFAIARKFMAETGNANQWAPDYPSEELIRKDIESGDCHVVLYGGKIVATFVLRPGIDPTYNNIYDGKWLNDLPYATIHRIASSGELKGVMHLVMLYAKQCYKNIRIDTHRDNLVMRRLIEKEGFKHCGTIRCWNGSERLACQLTFA